MTAADIRPRLARISRTPHQLLAWGIPMGPLTLLRTRGRKSGLRRTVPVVVLRHNGVKWLVSPFGDTHWVHNVRADCRAEFGRGRRFRQVRLVEVNDERKPDVLHHYRRRYGFVPFVRDAFDATPGDGTLAFEREADLHPVFIVEPDH